MTTREQRANQIARQRPPRQREALCRRIQHIFNKNSVSSCWIIYQNMGNGTDQFAVLNNRWAGHECVKYRTKFFTIFFDDQHDFMRIITKFLPPYSFCKNYPLSEARWFYWDWNKEAEAIQRTASASMIITEYSKILPAQLWCRGWGFHKWHHGIMGIPLGGAVLPNSGDIW